MCNFELQVHVADSIEALSKYAVGFPCIQRQSLRTQCFQVLEQVAASTILHPQEQVIWRLVNLVELDDVAVAKFIGTELQHDAYFLNKPFQLDDSLDSFLVDQLEHLASWSILLPWIIQPVNITMRSLAQQSTNREATIQNFPLVGANVGVDLWNNC
jgi:hypothetical protein